MLNYSSGNMFTLVQKAVGYFSGTAADSGLKSEQCERPKLEDFISISQLESEKFDGVVTSISDRDIVINSDIYFSIPFNQLKCKFKVGDSVQGIAERKTKYEAWRAVSLSLHVNRDWDTDRHKLSGEAIPCRDLVAGIPGILKNDLFSSDSSERSHPKTFSVQSKLSQGIGTDSHKTVIGKVKGIHADTVTLNEDTYFSLSSAESTFDLLEGDWIICKYDDDPSTQHHETNHLPGFVKVSRVDPLRKKKIRGEVTHFNSTHYIINNEVFCSSKLAKEVGVRVGDAVIMEVIESDQGHFCWRALSLSCVVSPTFQELKSGIASLSKFKGLAGEIKTSNLFEDKEGILISQSVRFPNFLFGSQSCIDVFIKNTGKESQVIRRVYFISASQECQFSVGSDESGGSLNDTSVTIMPNTSFNVKLICTGKVLGFSKQLCIFDFGNFHIGRYISATVQNRQIMCMAPTKPFTPHERQKPLCLQPRDGRIVRGEKPFRAPTFLPMSLPMYCVPSELWTAIENEDNILHVSPFLAQPVNQENYQDKFSVLLHLEEIEMTLQMRQFDMERTAFSSHGEFLSLTVPGLAEKRPSLMIGDTVIASSPCNVGGTEYEGYIHEVLHTQILLKFHPSFHNQYHGEDYAVRFNFNRTPLRRCHFALKFSMDQLGANVLFPTKLKVQVPQISYIDPEALSMNGKRKTSVDMKPRTLFEHEGNSSDDRHLVNVGEMKGRNGCSEKEAQISFENAIKKENSSTVELPSNDKIVYAKRMELNEDDVTDTLNYSAQDKPKNNDGNITGGHNSDEIIKVDVVCNGMQSEMCNKDDQMVMDTKKIDLDKCKYTCTDNAVESKGYKEFDNVRIINDKENSANSTKCVSKTGNNGTPPRIPVVTRLFGVPSSGSSANSSMCCSDDDSKSNIDFENECKFKRNGNEKEIFADVKRSNIDLDGDNNKSLKFRNDDSEKNSWVLSEEAYPSVETRVEKCPSWTLNMSNKTLNMSNNDLHYPINPIEEESQVGECKSLLQHTGTVKLNGVNGENIPFINKVKSSVVDVTLESKKSQTSLPDGHGCGGPVNRNFQYINRQRAQNRHLRPSQTQGKNPRKQPVLNKDKGSYYVPVLPIRSSIERKIQNEQVPLLKWVNKELNLEQKLAVRRILEGSTRPLPYVIYGPPGTGKTVTLVEAVLQIFTLIHHSRLLIVTPSNSAADLVTERLLMFDQLKKADLVRLNAYQRKDDSIPENIRSYCCNGDQLAVRIRQRVIITTATTAGLLYTLGLHNGHFTHVFVDEAGQLTEPECLVALGLVNSLSGQLVLAGDPQQLGPVVQSKLSKRFGLQESLLHRLCNSVLYQPEEKNNSSAWIYEPRLLTQLVKNYRSHPDVFAVPSKLFYHDSLQAHASMEIKDKLLSWEELPNSSCPLLFHGLVSDNLQEGDSPSWFNPTEAFQVVRYAKSLLHFGLDTVNIGIITPYRKQVQKIRKLLATFGIAEGIKVGTVEEFQGQEKSAIIISTVRSSEQLLEVDIQHSLGFVKCRRRFNVAITRAQSLLIVVGNPLLLTLDSCWMDFITFCIKKGAYRGPELHCDDQESND